MIIKVICTSEQSLVDGFQIELLMDVFSNSQDLIEFLHNAKVKILRSCIDELIIKTEIIEEDKKNDS